MKLNNIETINKINEEALLKDWFGKKIKIVNNPVSIDYLNQDNIVQKFETTLAGTDLSFAGVREYERTKHVHRLHPYLGKFIPQLVEVFLKHYGYVS